MGLRPPSIRLRIFLLAAIPILALTGLYAFVVSLTAGDALTLTRDNSYKNATAIPIFVTVGQIQAEQVLAEIYLASPTPQSLAALDAQQAKTDRARKAFTAAVTSPAATSNASPQEEQAIAAFRTDVAGLPALRSLITARTVTRPRAASQYDGMVAAANHAVNEIIIQEPSVSLVSQALAITGMIKSQQLILDEDALLAGDLAARSFPFADRQEFTQLAGARRAAYAQTLPELDPVYQAYYRKDISPPASAALTALENRVIYDTRPRGLPPVSPASWQHAVEGVSAGFTQAAVQSANTQAARTSSAARATYLRLILAGGLGLLAVVVSVVVSVLIGRSIVRPLAGLRRSVLELANERLPSVVARLRAGQDVDVTAEAPTLESSSDEIGQVRAAFNAAQRTAVQAAVDEARLRTGISDVFRNLARRSQSLLHRQLALLDALERRTSKPEELEDLFRIDHLTTRMRRHSEGLIILSGESPGRGWHKPVPLADVLRAAVAEVEDYTRIRVTTGTRAALVGSAVADVIHLIAELAENATSFSPPHTPVLIHGDTVGTGFAVEVEDRGLGIAEEKLAEINHKLAHPPEFDLSGSDQMGLFIAGQLARRHDIQVTMKPSPYGGITAIALIPQALVVDQDSIFPEPPAGTAAERAIRLTGRHAALHPGIDAEPTAQAELSALASAAGESSAPAGESPAPAGESSAPDADPRAVPTGATTPTDSVFAAGPRTSGTEGPPDDPSSWKAPDPRVPTTDPARLGLPVRVPQASLAPQLRDSGPFAAAATENAPGAPTPEAARSTVTALQRGWERGRRGPDAGAAPRWPASSPEPGGGGGTERSNE